jgi:hypothetical protein
MPFASYVVHFKGFSFIYPQVDYYNLKFQYHMGIQNIHPSCKWKTIDIFQASKHITNKWKNLLWLKDSLQESKIGIVIYDINKKGQKRTSL